MKGSAAKIQMTGLDDLFGIPAQEPGEHVQEIALSELHTFHNHPFHVLDDEKMQEMAESVAQYGVLVPGIVRPRPEGGYELIAGHRRKRACELAGLDTMCVIVHDMDDDEAVLIMVDSNLQREKILPSEKAFAYRMKLEAMNRKAGRPTKDNLTPVVSDKGQRTNEQLAAQVGESREQIRRYIRLTYLIPKLLEQVDKERLPLRPAVELSYIPKDEQNLLYEKTEDFMFVPSMEQAKKLREYSERVGLKTYLIEEIMSDEKPAPVKITLKKKYLRKYFPKDYTKEQMEEVIFLLLDKWKTDQEGEKPHGENG